MSVILLLSLIHVFPFFLLSIFIYKSKTIIFSIQTDIIITSLFKKVAKISTDNLKLHIKDISCRLEISKNIISA